MGRRLCADFWSFLGYKSFAIYRGNRISTFKKYVLSTKFCLETNYSSNLWNSAFSFLFPCFRPFRGDFCISVEYQSLAFHCEFLKSMLLRQGFLRQRIISTIARIWSPVRGFLLPCFPINRRLCGNFWTLLACNSLVFRCRDEILTSKKICCLKTILL